MPEATFTTLAGTKFLDDIKICLDYRHNDQLSQTQAGFEYKILAATIPARHKQLPLVIRIYQPDKIAQNNAMLVPQSGARQDYGSQPWVLYMYSDTGWN